MRAGGFVEGATQDYGDRLDVNAKHDVSDALADLMRRLTADPRPAGQKGRAGHDGPVRSGVDQFSNSCGPEQSLRHHRQAGEAR